MAEKIKELSDLSQAELEKELATVYRQILDAKKDHEEGRYTAMYLRCIYEEMKRREKSQTTGPTLQEWWSQIVLKEWINSTDEKDCLLSLRALYEKSKEREEGG